MLKAAFSLAFAAFLRAGEFTAPPQDFSPSLYATLRDVSFLDDGSLRFYIKRSKTDQFHRGCSITLPHIFSSICPVRRMKSYLRSCTAHDKSPLFHFKNGSPLSIRTLHLVLRKLLHKLGYEAQNFNIHSFRIGAATSAAKQGISNKMIKRLGRWKSQCFMDYIKLDT